MDQPQTPMGQSPQVEEPKKSSSLTWLLIVLVIAIVGGGIWYFTR